MRMVEKFSKRVENTMGKEEIARNEQIACDEQFLLFPKCFHEVCVAKLCAADA